MLIKSLLTPPSTLIDFLSLKIKGILKLSFGLYPQVGYIVIVLSFRTENRINIDQNYKSGDVWSEEFPIVSVKLFYWLEYFIQKNRTSLRDRSQFVAICVVCLVPWSLFLDYLMISLIKATCSLIIWWMGEAWLNRFWTAINWGVKRRGHIKCTRIAF